jgi:hypothetical protein
LHDANPSVSNPNIIRAGQRLVIPEADALTSSRATGKRATPKVKPVVKKKKVVKKKVRKKVAIPTKRTLKKVKPKKKRVVVAKKPRRTTKVASRGVWDRLAQCESGGNWSINTGNGFYGGVQFTASTWHAMGGTGLPHQASRETQIAIAKKLQARAGWGQWPGCSSKLGLR